MPSPRYLLYASLLLFSNQLVPCTSASHSLSRRQLAHQDRFKHILVRHDHGSGPATADAPSGEAEAASGPSAVPDYSGTGSSGTSNSGAGAMDTACDDTDLTPPIAGPGQDTASPPAGPGGKSGQGGASGQDGGSGQGGSSGQGGYSGQGGNAGQGGAPPAGEASGSGLGGGSGQGVPPPPVPPTEASSSSTALPTEITASSSSVQTACVPTTVTETVHDTVTVTATPSSMPPAISSFTPPAETPPASPATETPSTSSVSTSSTADSGEQTASKLPPPAAQAPPAQTPVTPSPPMESPCEESNPPLPSPTFDGDSDQGEDIDNGENDAEFGSTDEDGDDSSTAESSDSGTPAQASGTAPSADEDCGCEDAVSPEAAKDSNGQNQARSVSFDDGMWHPEAMSYDNGMYTPDTPVPTTTPPANPVPPAAADTANVSNEPDSASLVPPTVSPLAAPPAADVKLAVHAQSLAATSSSQASSAPSAVSSPPSTSAAPQQAESPIKSDDGASSGQSSGLAQYTDFSEIQFSVYSTESASGCSQTFATSGSCGLSTYFAGKFDAGLPKIAMPYDKVMAGHGASQNNALCGKTITVVGPNGKEMQAVVADSNVDATHNSIDTCMDIWEAFGMDAGGGRVMGKWKLNA